MNVRDLSDLSGRVAIVTGGRGLYGTPISEGLAEAGAVAVIASRSEEECEEVARSLRGRGLSACGARLNLDGDSPSPSLSGIPQSGSAGSISWSTTRSAGKAPTWALTR